MSRRSVKQAAAEPQDEQGIIRQDAYIAQEGNGGGRVNLEEGEEMVVTD